MRYSNDPIWQKFKGGGSLVLMIWFAVAILSGCVVGPDFQRPHTTLPADWSEPAVEPRPVTSAETQLSRWWTLFDDPTLAALVDSAVQSNLDLKQAEAR